MLDNSSSGRVFRHLIAGLAAGFGQCWWVAALAADANAAIRPGGLTEAGPTYYLTAPPRDGAAGGEQIYEPIAEFLTKATGRRFVYVPQDNWLIYQSKMRTGSYDLIFDGPHFVGWRALRLDHTPLLKLPQPHIWVVVAGHDNRKVAEVKNLAGRLVCAHAPPNFGTLTLQAMFNNPARQPIIREIKGWDAAYRGVADGQCAGTILPKTNLQKLDPELKHVKVIHEHAPYPNQALTASSRIPPELRTRIVAALGSPEGKIATTALRERFAKGADLVPATREEYFQVAEILRSYWGFEF